MHTFASVNIVGGDAGIIDLVLRDLSKTGIAIEGNPDIWIRSYDGMGVDDARELRDRATFKAVGGGYRIFIFSAASITHEAQNALLKTLEEPAGDALFFIIVPSPETLLATVRSRAQIVSYVADAAESIINVKSFLSSPHSTRLEMLKPLLEKGDDDKRDMGAVITFLSELEKVLSGSMKNAEAREGLHAVLRARSFIVDKGALVKPLLEHVALLVPMV